jgi:hypothetical protein
MKTMKTFFATILLAGLFFTSCSGDSEDFDLDTGIIPPSAQSYADLKKLADELVNLTRVFNAEDGISFTSPKGVLVNIPANCLVLSNGNLATGEVTLEYKEIFDRGNMLATNRTTMGRMPDGNKALLISGGEFFIEASQNNQPLSLSCGMQLQVPTELTGGPDPEMILWTGTIDENDNLTWDEVRGDAAGNGDGVFVEGQTYFVFLDSFGWTNVDRFYSDPRPKTTLLVETPTGFTNQNSAVYLSYDGEGNSALANLDTFDPITNRFSEHYGQIPVGLEMHIIFATEENGQWRYAIKGVTVAANDIYVFTLSETVVGSHADLVAAINNLP